MITLRSKDDCTFDMIALGEIMLRLDPGDMRVRNARQFRVWEGGGEYNVARGLRRCFGLTTGVITALAGGDPVADKGYAISMVSTSFIQLQYGVISGVRVSTFTRWVDTV